MPFSTDTQWPQGLLDIFGFHRTQKYRPMEYLYFGPYIKLLNYALAEDFFTFLITPRTTYKESIPRHGDYVDGPFTNFLVVMNKEHKPVLFAEINSDGWVNRSYDRKNADTQMRRRFNLMLHECPIPRLYGLSLMGTSLRIYFGDKATCKITPHSTPDPERDITPSGYLQGQWNLDILSPDGLSKMQEIIGYIKAEVEAANVVGSEV